MQKAIFDFFADFIFKETGIVYNEKNDFALKNRLGKMVKDLNYSSIDDFYAECSKGLSPSLRNHILDVATNNETQFFRNAEVFKEIENKLLMPMIDKGQLHFDIWSAACSFGQEAFSVMMVIEELKAKTGKSLTYSIQGSDISNTAIQKCKSATYTQFECQRGLATMLLVKYFDKTQENAGPGIPVDWVVKPQFRRSLLFENVNLLEKYHSARKFDIILCRNMLIYHTNENRRKVLENIWTHLKDPGHLVLGTAEGVTGFTDWFGPLDGSSNIFVAQFNKDQKTA